MSETFKKFKRRYTVEAALKSAAIGLSCGLFAVGVVLLALKLSGIDLHFAFYILIGVVAALASGAGLFFIFRPSDLACAKRLDREYGLNEKIQTMVEFAGREGDILTLQRENADEALNNLQKPKRTAKSFFKYLVTAQIWVCILCFVLAAAVFVAGMVIPPRARENDDNPPIGEEDEGDYDYSLVQQSSIADLVLDIRNSSLSESSIKPAFLAIIAEMDESLKEVKDEDDMRKCVVGAVTLLDGVTDTANTYQKICAQLKTLDEELATAITNAVAVYKTYSAQLSNFRFIKSLELDLGDMIKAALSDALENSKKPLLLTSNSDAGDALNNYVTGLTAALNSSGVSESDELYTAVNDLRVALRAVYNDVIGGYGYTALNTKIGTAFTSFANALEVTLKEQSYNRVMDIYVRTKLADIFGIKISELPALADAGEGESSGGNGGSSGGSGSEGEGSGGSSSGGFGEGGEIFGSNDLVYDPDTGEYVEYGTLLNAYYQKYFERILKGDFDYVSEYYNILFSGIDASNNK